ncbi:endocytosis defective- protein [Phytophthora pseudosyringae]|uniref:Endocytosis defective- protein n=1 Tax=Phytophthora pseudosyringae TaxID=221518 RepID=A0A8T1VNQ9_9STRA|nr:endocytosis defective- protein [Phytophthora pseudosyringae]
MNVVQLARLHKFHEFLKFDRPSIKRVILELIPDTMGDVAEYERFRAYLIKGRQNQPRAGVALEMESQGYKVFILPPGQEAQWLGYHGDMMLAVVRSSW